MVNEYVQLPLEEDHSWYLKKWWPYALIIISCILLYAQSLWYGFSPMDEYWLITAEKEHLSHLSNLPNLFSYSTLGMYYRPMLAVTFLFDTVAGNGGTFCFHLTNILLHISCSLLVFRFFLSLNLGKTVAFFSALIFAVHPVNIHAVAWIPGRNDSLLTMFTLLSCICLLRYLKENKLYWILLHVLFFTCTLFTKESAIVLPVIYLILIFFFAKKNNFRFVLSICIAWLILAVGWFLLRNHIVGYLLSTPSDGITNTLIRFISSLLLHTGKIILPVEQSVFPLLQNTSLWPFIIVLMLTLLLFLKFGVRDKQIALLGLIWFFILIALPAWYGSANIFGEQYEHRDYTPLAGALLFLSQLKLPVSRGRLKFFALIIVILFSIKSFTRIPVYKNEFIYAKTGAAEAPSVSVFHYLLGIMYEERNNPKEALESLNSAIALDSGNGDFFMHRAKAYSELGDYQHALSDDNKALQIDSTIKEAYLNRGFVNFKLGNFISAKSDFEKGEQLGGKADSIMMKSLNDSLNASKIIPAK
ncbi:tetratricopeptide repeat protein [soil metagenome]